MTAAIYARKSTEQSGVADDQKSVARQIEHARAYAARKGWTVVDEHVYVDDGISGAEFTNRPGFLRLMNSVKPLAPFQVLVMSEESRLGRESLEVGYALKQLVQAGVRVFLYLEDLERTIDSPIEKIMLQLSTFADEMERDRARQRTCDAMLRKAKAGHVTGGACFGYRNVDVVGVNGRRSHVTREIEPTEAEIIRTIFRLCADGSGVKGIAKALNNQGARSPRAQLGRSQTWAPTSVRAVLYRPLYRGEIVYGRTVKRDRWGHKHQKAQPETGWIRRPAPELRIVTDQAWSAAHARLTAARSIYFRTNGRQERPPALAGASKYLLTNLAMCGVCGGPLRVRTRSHGNGRKAFYGCAWYHERGTTACGNGQDVPMADGDEIVIEALLDDVLDASMLEDAADEALRVLQGDGPNARLDRVKTEIATVTRERDRLVSAIASGGELAGLLEALRARDTRQRELEAEREALGTQRHLKASETARVRDELVGLAQAWRHVLAHDVPNARPIITTLLKGRVTFAPLETRHRWVVRGEGTLAGLFERAVYPLVVRPHGDVPPTGIPFERAFRAA